MFASFLLGSSCEKRETLVKVFQCLIGDECILTGNKSVYGYGVTDIGSMETWVDA